MFELSLSRNTFSLCVICLAVTGDLVVFCAVVLPYDGRGHSYAPCILWEETINVCMGCGGLVVKVFAFGGIDVVQIWFEPRDVLGQDTLSPSCLLSTKYQK